MTMPSRVLVVEDNSLNLKLVRDVLLHAGFDVVEARSGEDGIARALAYQPDIILMDLQPRHRRHPGNADDQGESGRIPYPDRRADRIRDV